MPGKVRHRNVRRRGVNDWRCGSLQPTNFRGKNNKAASHCARCHVAMEAVMVGLFLAGATVRVHGHHGVHRGNGRLGHGRLPGDRRRKRYARPEKEGYHPEQQEEFRCKGVFQILVSVANLPSL